MVGGTTGTTTEKAWTDGGGGFSNYFDRPTWQEDQVTSWLNKNSDGNTAYYNTAGRAYPDVAAAATYFEIVVDGSTEVVDGTSCAAPTFASVIELVNSNRIAAGKSALGFLNPWLVCDPSTAPSAETFQSFCDISGDLANLGCYCSTETPLMP